MGYYTRHELTIISGNDNFTDYEKEICETADNEYLFEEESKWYDCESDMKEYSKKHPNVVFCIDGVGEEFPDIWKAYYKNGKVFITSAQIVFEEFSEDKLI